MNWIKGLLVNKLAVYLVAVAICLLGIFSLFFITVSPFPAIALNGMRIHLGYPGANAATVETQVTKKVADALQGIANIAYVSTRSTDNAANIQLNLNSIKPEDLIKTRMKIQQAIASVNLPRNVSTPNIEQFSGGSTLVNYVLTSDRLSLFQINNFIHAKILPKFTAIHGVNVDTGGQRPVVHIYLLPNKLAQYHLNITDVGQKINNVFKANSLGDLYLGGQAYTLGVSNSLESFQDFKQLVVGYSSGVGQPIYLKDIATISFSPRSLIPTFYSSYNGHESEEVDLWTGSDANPFQVYKISNNYIKRISAKLPADLKITMIENQAESMHDSFSEVVVTVIFSIILVVLIILIFLGRFRITLIPIVTIPVCLLGAVGLVACLGYSLNLLTLLSMIVAVGLVVDDAVVVMENIIRHLEHGMNKFDAIVHGTADIAKTILGITATLLAVYLPIVFCDGIVVTMMKAFAVPLAAAVFLSGIVALTLTPVMCAKLITSSSLNNYQKQFNKILSAIIDAYQVVLKRVLRAPIALLVLMVVLVSAGVYYDSKIPTAVFPKDPSGSVYIDIKPTPQDTIETLKNKFTAFSTFYHDSRVKDYSIQIDKDPISGKLNPQMSIQYKKEYLRQSQYFSDRINAFIKKNHLQNMKSSIGLDSSWGMGPDVHLTLFGDDSVNNINKKAALLIKIMKKSPMFSNVDNSIQLPYKQLSFSVDSVLAAKFGLYHDDIMSLLSSYFGGYNLDNNFSIQGLSVPVLVQLDAADLKNPNALQKLRIQSPLVNEYLPLSKFVSMQMVAKPKVIEGFNGQPSVDLNADLAKGYSLSDAIPYMNKLLENHAPGLSYEYLGKTADYLKGNKQTILIALLGFVCIYFFLAILFSSLVDPLIILLTVPFAVVGGAFSLYVMGDSINIYSSFALITLVGLITKHGVLIVQFANHELHRGATAFQAVLTATHDRFRPIIITTLAMILGALPLLFSSGEMYVARRDLGSVLIVGLLVGTLFSLFVVPMAYVLIKRVKHEGVE